MEDLGCSQMLWHPTRPAVATSHDIGFLSWRPEAKMHRAIDRLLLYFSYLGLKRMDAVIAVSEYSRQKIIEQLGISPERVFTVHSGNDRSHFNPIASARAKLEERYGFPKSLRLRVLLYVGAEFPRKNLRKIFQTLKLLPSNVRLLKVGAPGGERFRTHTRKMITELGVGDRVVFFDQIPEEDLPLFYSAADIYVCASYLEGFCHPVVEAMSCGTPIVCSNAGALPEITRDAAILISPEDDYGFIEAIRAVLYDDSLRQQMIISGLQQATSFSWERTAEQVIDVYRKVVKND
jgi:glycosyltransferase involved in cell wall biosynthesis